MLSTASLIFLLTISFAAAKHESCVGNCTYAASEQLLATVNLKLFKTSYDDYIEVPITDPMALSCEIDNSKPTHVYTYGWIRALDPESIRAVINAYIRRNSCNIILVDYKKIANTPLIFAEGSAEGVGYNLAKAINKLHEAGLNKTGLTFVGHSLGGQISGYAGRYLNFKLHRITALDPAGPGFYAWRTGLTPNDAEFVATIHTDTNFFGMKLPTGHADFYVNGGYGPQPGCPTVHYCSHYRAVYCYIESIMNDDAFIGRQCTTYQGFKAGSCSPGPVEIMGYATPTTAKGRYFLETNGKEPYGRRELGATYHNADNVVSSKVDKVTTLVESK